MNRFDIKDNKLILYVGQKEKVLSLDCNNYLANKSRYPMYISAEFPDSPTILNLIMELTKSHEEISLGTKEGMFAALLMDVTMTTYLIRTAKPVKVLELGATNGVLSYHLAMLMGKLNPETSLCCVSNVIGNGSENRWLNRVSRVEQPPVLSMVVSDYENTPLAPDYFDIVIINGTECFENPDALIREADRLLKTGGKLLCHAVDAPLLGNCFREAFPDSQEYEITPNDKLWTVTYEGTYEGKKLEPNIKEEMRKIINKLKATLELEENQAQLRALITEIDHWADEAIKYYDIDSKKDLIHLKQLIMDYMLNVGDRLEGYYKEKLESFWKWGDVRYVHY